MTVPRHEDDLSKALAHFEYTDKSEPKNFYAHEIRGVIYPVFTEREFVLGYDWDIQSSTPHDQYEYVHRQPESCHTHTFTITGLQQRPSDGIHMFLPKLSEDKREGRTQVNSGMSRNAHL